LPTFRIRTTTASPFLSLIVEVDNTLTSGFCFFTTTPLPSSSSPFDFAWSFALLLCVDSQPVASAGTRSTSTSAQAARLIRSRH
jgi:hypothetical protein